MGLLQGLKKMWARRRALLLAVVVLLLVGFVWTNWKPWIDVEVPGVVTLQAPKGLVIVLSAGVGGLVAGIYLTFRRSLR